jgi:hypothetical protein
MAPPMCTNIGTTIAVHDESRYASSLLLPAPAA